MGNEAVATGSVFVSYAHADEERVSKLLDGLKGAGFRVWWDDDITIGQPFREQIDIALHTASAITVVWTQTSITRAFVIDEATEALQKGILVPVVLDADLQPPLGFRQLEHAKLEGWTGGDHRELRKLLSSLSRLVGLGPTKQCMPTLSSDNFTIGNSQSIVSIMQNSTREIRRLGDALATEAPAAANLRGGLDEVGKTYHAVNSAILSFKKPAAQQSITADPYLELESSDLRSKIAAGRGHCHNIDNYYRQSGGLRESIVSKVSEADLTAFDDAFSKLGKGDQDLFEPLEEIGELLSNESRAVASLLLTSQQEAARQRILDGRAKLQPLEDQLGAAMMELQRIESSLGYPPPVN